jgi:hypothetical protein
MKATLQRAGSHSLRLRGWLFLALVTSTSLLRLIHSRGEGS